MKLSFDREAAREAYLSAEPSLKKNKRRLELLLLRLELLTRNSLFLKEWEELNNWKRPASADVDDEWIEDKWNVFVNRWYIVPKGFLFHPALREQAAVERMPEKKDERNKYTAFIEVDIRYSKRRIMNAVEDIIDRHQKIVRDSMDFKQLLPEDSAKELEEISRGVKDGKVSADPDDYIKALKVWDLRNEGKSWSEIQKELCLNNLQAGRNWQKKASELIKKGIPTLPAFPQE